MKTRVRAKVRAGMGFGGKGRRTKRKRAAGFFLKEKRPGIGPFQFFLLFL